jgi:hypothetical protein
MPGEGHHERQRHPQRPRDGPSLAHGAERELVAPSPVALGAGAHRLAGADDATIGGDDLGASLPAVLERSRPDDPGGETGHRGEGLPTLDADVLASADALHHAGGLELGLQRAGDTLGGRQPADWVPDLEQSVITNRLELDALGFDDLGHRGSLMTPP